MSLPKQSYSPTLNNLRGIMWMLAAVIALTLMFAIVKQMVTELPVFVVAIMRTAVGLALLLPWILRVGPAGLRTGRLGTHFVRAVLGIAAFVCVVYALSRLLLADAIVLAFTSPLWSIVVSALILREIAGPRRIAATVAGFIGVLLIVKPHGGIEPAMLLALGSALLTALAMIMVKHLSATEPPTRNVFFFFLFGTLLLLPPAAVTWQTPTLVQFGWLFAAGFLGVVGQEWLARAYDAGEVTIVAPFDFLRLPIAAVIGFLVFSEVPDSLTIAGTLIIIAASLYIARREAVAKRAHTPTR